MTDRSSRFWFALFVLAVFCTGAGAGVLGGRFLGRPGLLGGPPPGGQSLEELNRQLTSELGLDAAQQQQLGAVLEASRTRVDRFRHDAQVRFEQEHETLQGEIRKVLNENQRVKFAAWLRKNGSPGPPPGGPPGPPPGRPF
ncbi:MAG: hypothetical protein NTY02_15555 [Acidobacteria bacterium]|nr:hypothetical protein [Acidobacteriota bacterium]